MNFVQEGMSPKAAVQKEREVQAGAPHRHQHTTNVPKPADEKLERILHIRSASFSCGHSERDERARDGERSVTLHPKRLPKPPTMPQYPAGQCAVVTRQQATVVSRNVLLREEALFASHGQEGLCEEFFRYAFVKSALLNIPPSLGLSLLHHSKERRPVKQE